MGRADPPGAGSTLIRDDRARVSGHSIRALVLSTHRNLPVQKPYVAAPTRYDAMPYRRTGRSGLDLPAISLGLWQNFGGEEIGRASCRERV